MTLTTLTAYIPLCIQIQRNKNIYKSIKAVNLVRVVSPHVHLTEYYSGKENMEFKETEHRAC